MVAATKENERTQFAKRLNEALGKMPNAPRAGRRASWLRELLRAEGVQISVEAVRKWLVGDSMPDQTHMGMLARLADCDVNWLHTGQPSRSKDGSTKTRGRDELAKYHGVDCSPEGARLGAEWDKLPDEIRTLIQVEIHLLVASHMRGELLAQFEKPKQKKPPRPRPLAN